MPQRTGAIPKSLLDFYIKVIADNFDQFVEIDTFKYESIKFWRRTESEGFYAVFDSLDNNKLLYFVNYNTVKIINTKSVRQTLVHNVDKTHPRTAGLAKHIVINILLPRFGVIASDIEQSMDGERLWVYLIDFSIDVNKVIYLVSVNSKKVTKLSSSQDNTLILRSAWSENESSKDLVFVISNEKVPEFERLV